MNPIILKIGYGIILICTFIIRYSHEKHNKANQIVTNKRGVTETVLLGFAFVGMMLLPLINIFTRLFSFANYSIPSSIQLIGLFLIFPMLWLFYRSHKDLGQNWSATLEIREGHQIVDSGVYKYIRHPMYSAIWLWVIIQALLLNNYIAGLSGLVSFGLLYYLRVGKEEEMMIEEFGEIYGDYPKKNEEVDSIHYLKGEGRREATQIQTK